MIEGIEKAVVRNPLTVTPKPVYAPSHRSANPLMRRLTFLEENSSWVRVPGVIAAAMRA
jgi:aldehyde dehydrogenase (NAD(P)+)